MLCNRAHRQRLEKLLHLEPPRSPGGHFKSLMDPGGGCNPETAAIAHVFVSDVVLRLRRTEICAAWEW
jgi:hypothetical protein